MCKLLVVQLQVLDTAVRIMLTTETKIHCVCSFGSVTVRCFTVLQFHVIYKQLSSQTIFNLLHS